jgi:hypothetical protein
MTASSAEQDRAVQRSAGREAAADGSQRLSVRMFRIAHKKIVILGGWGVLLCSSEHSYSYRRLRNITLL